jgi:two-component system NtrC family response regulator/two-component system nitrogen regulation response regulator GlnG
MARILVIDDDPGYQAAMRRLLVLEGHEVRVAGSGEEGLGLLMEEPADLVVVDLMMAGMGGIRTVLAIRERLPGIRILVATGAREVLADDMARNASWLGDASALSKPFDDREFLRAVRRILEAE